MKGWMSVKIGFIGCGNMGGALACAVIKELGSENVFVFDTDTKKMKDFASRNEANVSDIEYIASNCDYIFLGVKPQVISAVLENVSPFLEERITDFTLVSMAAGVSLSQIASSLSEECSVIRIMPNIPAKVGDGVILYCANEFTSNNQKDVFVGFMKEAGLVDEIDENKIDAASCISGCGPAFAFMFIEALADGGVECGLPRDKAMLYAAKMLAGSAEMVIKSGEHPGALKDAVCSPAGSTIEGVKALENGAFRSLAMNAVRASFDRTKELGKK